MYRVKEDKTDRNVGRAGLRNSIVTHIAVIFMILASASSLSYSGPISMIWNTQSAVAASISSHTSTQIALAMSPLLREIQFLPSISDSISKPVALVQFPATRLPGFFPVAPVLTSPLISQNPFNAMTAAAATLSSPLGSITANQIVPLVQGTTNSGFVSYLCPGTAVQTTPSPSLINFGAATTTYNSVLPIVTGTPSIPLTGTFTLYNPLFTGGTVPIVTGQINAGTLSGNSFTLQGTLTTSGVSGVGAFCNSVSASSFFPFAFNTFTISGTCGTNLPLAFAIDRSVIGAFNARVACNSF